jgi:hypothetical protein
VEELQNIAEVKRTGMGDHAATTGGTRSGVTSRATREEIEQTTVSAAVSESLRADEPADVNDDKVEASRPAE